MNIKQKPSAPQHDQDREMTAMLIIDMINPFDFKGAAQLKPKAMEAVRTIKTLSEKMKAAGLPIIYVNDNFGEWHSEKSQLVAHTLEGGNPIVELLAPAPNDYFIIKPQFSGFYATNLPVLLPKLGVRRLILTGVATDICILFTAADAHMRDYELWIPRDAVAAEDDKRGDWALALMQESMGAETSPISTLEPSAWVD